MTKSDASTARRRILLLVIVLSAFASVFFAWRSYGTFLLLRSAYASGKPELSSLRAWMTLTHVAATYRVPADELIPRLGLPPDTGRSETLKSIADRRGVSRFAFVQQVQRAIGAAAPMPVELAGANEKSGNGLSERVLSAVLAYGYPAFAATLLLGAIGMPVPTGLAAVLAGSLAALGHIQWIWAALIAVLASVAGDALAYAIGRAISINFLTRHGRWFGYSAARKDRLQALFSEWGALTVVFSRTLVSHLSSLMSLLAGISHYRLMPFLFYSSVGRLIWASAYLGLGYGIGTNIEVASDFMANLTGLLASLTVLSLSGAYRAGVFSAPRR